MANFCFLNNADNQKIKDKSPKVYAKLLNEDRKKEILKAALCPQDTFSVDYNDFVEKRKSILLEYAQALIK